MALSLMFSQVTLLLSIISAQPDYTYFCTLSSKLRKRKYLMNLLVGPRFIVTNIYCYCNRHASNSNLSIIKMLVKMCFFSFPYFLKYYSRLWMQFWLSQYRPWRFWVKWSECRAPSVSFSHGMLIFKAENS